MSEEISIKNVSKFDGTNFQAWKFQVNAILVAYGLSDIVKGTRTKPACEASNEFKSWVKDNAKAMVVLSSSIDATQLECLLTCSTAAEMWTTLSTIHEQKSASSKLLLTQRFHEYRMGASDSVVQHVARIQNMASQLRDLGETISDVAIMAKILASLPSKYSSLVTAWDSVEAANQTIANLQIRLLKEEGRLNAEEEAATAMTAMTIGERKKSGKQKPKTKKDKTDAECFYCKRRGHFARECRKKKRDAANEKDGKDGGNSVKCAFVTTVADKNKPMGATAPTADEVGKLLDKNVNEVWLLDSGSSRHITHRREWYCEFTPNKGESVLLGDDGVCEAYGSGRINIQRLVDGVWCDGTIENVLYVPKVKKNLFSVGVCANQRFNVLFTGRRVFVSRDGEVKAQGVQQENDVYRMFIRVKPLDRRSDANVSTSLQLLHERLGHVNQHNLKDMLNKETVRGVKVKDSQDFLCETCKLGKAHRLPFKQKETLKKTVNPGELIHSDVCGPFSVESVGGSKYFVSFKDEATGYRSVYFLKHKSDVYEKFKEYDKMVANKFGATMKTLRVDNGTEYVNGDMKRYLASRGIVMQNTAPYTPEQNGKAERENRTIVESARTMLLAKKLPLHLWAEAINTAVYVLNRTTSRANPNTTPYTLWTGKKPDVSHLRIFGSDAYAHIDKQFRKKLDPKARKVIFVGYQAESSNYRLYDPNTRKIVISRDVFFNERSQFSPSGSAEETCIGLRLPACENEKTPEEDDDDDDGEVFAEAENDEIAEAVNPATSSHHKRDNNEIDKQSCDQTRRLRDRSSLRRPARYEVNYTEYSTPTSYQEAVTGPDAEYWKEAIESELEAHEKNRTWDIVPREINRQPIDSKWVFKVLRDSAGEVCRYKARLCARGFLQKPGQDYTETFSPVVRYDSLRVLLAIITEKNLEVTQFDIKTAFLYGELKEEIHMEIPQGLNVESKKNSVCKLIKSLYGLKQSPRCWNARFNEFLKTFNLKPSEADKCIFYGMVDECEVYLALFVDDGLIAAKSKQVLDSIIKALRNSFEITLGDASMFVGMQIERDRATKSMFIHQRLYIEKILEKFNMTNAKAVSVPADPHTLMYPVDENEPGIFNVPYREAVGSLMFLSVVTRPDITFAVNAVSKFSNKHSRSHWEAVKRIFRYLIGTKDVGIAYRSGGSNSSLIGFSDADYAKDLETRRSITGYAFFLSNGIVTWSSERQKHVTLSTTEAEYVAAAAAAKEAVWLRKLLNDVGNRCCGPTPLKIDNQSSIKLVKNPEYHKRTKHIDIRYHYIRERYDEDDIDVDYIQTELQRADIFTKALSKEKFRALCVSLGLVSSEVLKRRECWL